MPSSTLPSYYIPPPHPNHLSRSTSTTSTLPKRPTVLDSLFTDLLLALGNSSSDTEVENPLPPPAVQPQKSKYLDVNNELKNLKRSISDRNLSDSRRSTQELKTLDRILEDHKREIQEFEAVKLELKKEKEENIKLREENQAMRLEFERKLEENKKANKKALKILMNLQKQEFINYQKRHGHGRDFSGSGNGNGDLDLDEIDQGVKRRINDWERNARSSTIKRKDKEIVKERRSSSPESDVNVRVAQQNGRRSPNKSIRTKSTVRTSKLSPIREREKYPFTR